MDNQPDSPPATKPIAVSVDAASPNTPLGGDMLNRFWKSRRGEGGFTLIELLIVIIVLGILAAIVIFSVGGITDKGSKSSCQTTVKTVDTAAEAYFAQTGAGAGTIGALVTNGYLHADSNFTTGSGTSVVISAGGKTYTVSYTAGTSSTSGNADGTTCPSAG